MRERTLRARMKREQERTINTILLRKQSPSSAWWLSFAADDGFRGAVIVHAEDFLTALMECNLRDINPHGECQGIELPPEMAALIPDKWKNRILDREQCANFDLEMTELRRFNDREEGESHDHYLHGS